LKPVNNRQEILWGMTLAVLLGISYWLARYVLFSLHGMKQWPDWLAILSLLIILAATVFKSRVLSIATVAGYIGGFILAMIFNQDGLDAGGGRTNNAWIIWGAVWISSILLGVLAGSFARQRKANLKE